MFKAVKILSTYDSLQKVQTPIRIYLHMNRVQKKK